MSDDATPRLALPYLAAAQAQKHVTVNAALTRLDALVQTAVASRTLATQPSAPPDGALYLLPADAAGADWTGQGAGALMQWEAGAWTAIAAAPGLVALIEDEAALVVRTAAGWVDLSALIHALGNLAGLGVNAAADTYNRLVVKSAAALFDHVGAGVQVKLDKAAPGDSAAVLFQTGYGGRAEIGLCGDDDLHLRVSADGASFADAVVVQRASGRIGMGVAGPTSRLHVGGCVRVAGYARAALPDPAAEGAGAICFLTDEVGGATLVFSDGAAWRRTADRAVAS